MHQVTLLLVQNQSIDSKSFNRLEFLMPTGDDLRNAISFLTSAISHLQDKLTPYWSLQKYTLIFKKHHLLLIAKITCFKIRLE